MLVVLDELEAAGVVLAEVLEAELESAALPPVEPVAGVESGLLASERVSATGGSVTAGG